LDKFENVSSTSLKYFFTGLNLSIEQWYDPKFVHGPKLAKPAMVKLPLKEFGYPVML
jgi:hypothetical protein